MKKFLKVCLVLVLALSLVACNNSSNGGGESGNNEGGDTEKKVRVALVTNVAGNSAFIDDGIAGFKETADKFGWEYSVAECAADEDYVTNAEAFNNEGYDLIVGLSWQATEAIKAVASNPQGETAYALLDDSTGLDNVKDVKFREAPGAYLIGRMAGLVVNGESHNYAAVHAMDSLTGWQNWRYPFMQGVLSVDPEAKFEFRYVNSYSDPDKAKELAQQLAAFDCKFINAACAGGDYGVFAAADELGFYTSGQDEDLTDKGENVISCQLKDTYNAMAIILETYKNGWNTDDEVLSIAEDTIGAVWVTKDSKVAPRHEVLTDEIIADLKDTAEKLKKGEIDLTAPEDQNDYPKITG